MEQPGYRDRPTIEERATRREQIHAGGKDRYSSLIDALSHGRPLPSDRKGSRAKWHPVLGLLIRVIVIVVVGYLAALYGWRWWRQQQTDTWSGPTAAVISGQRLNGCAAANIRNDDAEPTWIRWNGAVFVQTDSVFPVLNNSRTGQTQFTETGYVLSQLRIVLPAGTPPDRPSSELMVVSPPGIAATVYRLDTSCI